MNSVVHLSLNQGTTAVREEFGARAREILKDRADLMRKRVVDFATALPVHTIELGSMARLPGDYIAGHALGVSYALDTLPDEVTLRADLQSMVRTYRALTFVASMAMSRPKPISLTNSALPNQPTSLKPANTPITGKLSAIVLRRGPLKNFMARAVRPVI